MSYRIVEVKSQGAVKLNKDVGFGSLSNHFLQRSRQDGADFNLLVIGRAGSGRATLLSTLYQADVLSHDRRRHARTISGIEFVEHSSEIEEAGMTLRLKVTEVLGYGELSFGSNAKNHESKISAIAKHVEDQLQKHFERENCAHRPNKKTSSKGPSSIYHAAIVFVQPGHGLKLSKLDLSLLQTLQPRVNLIPVISKADTYLPSELARIKANLKAALFEAKVLQFPNITDISDDDWVVREAVEVRAFAPFALIAAERSSAHSDMRIRDYPWGRVAADMWSADGLNPHPAQSRSLARLRSASTQNVFSSLSANFIVPHADLDNPATNLHALQRMLIASHFEFLKRQTVDRLYENYRTEIVCLSAPAPEAPMRLAKSSEQLQQSAAIDTEETGEAHYHAEHVHEEYADAIDEQLAVYHSTSLDPIREEDESAPAEHATNGGDGRNRRGKKRSSHGKLKGSRSIEDLKEPLESPLPTMQ